MGKWWYLPRLEGGVGGRTVLDQGRYTSPKGVTLEKFSGALSLSVSLWYNVNVIYWVMVPDISESIMI